MKDMRVKAVFRVYCCFKGAVAVLRGLLFHRASVLSA